MQLVGQAAVEYSVRHGVTMVMVTEIKPGKEAAYRAWADRIQKLQATFPGYIGSFVQPPQHNETGLDDGAALRLRRRISSAGSNPMRARRW